MPTRHTTRYGTWLICHSGAATKEPLPYEGRVYAEANSESSMASASVTVSSVSVPPEASSILCRADQTWFNCHSSSNGTDTSDSRIERKRPTQPEADAGDSHRDARRHTRETSSARAPTSRTSCDPTSSTGATCWTRQPSSTVPRPTGGVGCPATCLRIDPRPNRRGGPPRRPTGWTQPRSGRPGAPGRRGPAEPTRHERVGADVEQVGLVALAGRSTI